MDWMTNLMQMLSQMRMPGAQTGGMAMPPMPQMGAGAATQWGIPGAPRPLPTPMTPMPRPVAAPTVAPAPVQAPVRSSGMGVPVGGGGGPGQERNNGMNAQFYQQPRLGNMMQPRR